MMEDDCVCEYDSTWDTESDGDDPAGESQTRRSCQDKNKSGGWTLVSSLYALYYYTAKSELKVNHVMAFNVLTCNSLFLHPARRLLLLP